MTKRRTSADDKTESGAGAPPPYVELSWHFVSLESASRACGDGGAGFYLQKARMSSIKAHASRPVQRTDMSQFCEPQQGGGWDTAEYTVRHYSVVQHRNVDWGSVLNV